MTQPRRALLQAAAATGRALLPTQAEQLGRHLAEAERPDEAAWLAHELTSPAYTSVVLALLDAWAAEPYVSGATLGAAVAASAHAHALARSEHHVELVLSGPSSPAVQARRTEQVLLQLLDGAESDILLVTYALYMYEDLKRSLQRAIDRGVQVTLLAESHRDNKAFTGDAEQPLRHLDATLLRWPADRRPTGAAMHAKLAVVDNLNVLVTSANATRRAAGDNLEAGLLLRSPALARRLHDHFADLVAAGVLLLTGNGEAGDP